jgi:hypothetical protein
MDRQGDTQHHIGWALEIKIIKFNFYISNFHISIRREGGGDLFTRNSNTRDDGMFAVNSRAGAAKSGSDVRTMTEMRTSGRGLPQREWRRMRRARRKSPRDGFPARWAPGKRAMLLAVIDQVLPSTT